MESTKLPKNFRDITGQRFGRLTAISPTSRRLCGHVVWECLCDCGEITFAAVNNLKQGHTQSCGCMHSQIVSQKSRNDLAGQRFGRLTAIHPTEQRANGSIVWECQCDCGKTALASAASLRKGDTTSCGCVFKENISKRRRADLSGQRFGYLTAVHPTQQRSHGCIVWECRCDCGETVLVPSERLTSGNKKSCGCISLREYARLH